MKKLIFDYAKKADKVSYGGLRSHNDVIGLVIHYTGNAGDTAKNNCDYFNHGNTRSAGAHIFIDGKGLSGRSIPLNRIAWSVGNPKGAYKIGPYGKMLNNSNTVSIELCDIVDHGVTDAQRETLIKVCKWLAKKKQCPKIKYVVRHYDIVQKDCPHYYVKNQKEWFNLQLDIMNAMEISH